MVLSQKQKDHRREYYKTYYTPEVAEHKRKYREQHKARYLRNYALKNWRKAKVKGDLEDLYENVYIPETNCWCCNHDFSKYQKCMDHDHNTGEFRQILCQACNNNDSWLKYYLQ